MVGYIECRSCDSPDCKGCNLKTLETMLKNGKFDCLMNENRAINASTDISPVVRGHFVHGAPRFAGGIAANATHWCLRLRRALTTARGAALGWTFAQNKKITPPTTR